MVPQEQTWTFLLLFDFYCASQHKLWVLKAEFRAEVAFLFLVLVLAAQTSVLHFGMGHDFPEFIKLSL